MTCFSNGNIYVLTYRVINHATLCTMYQHNKISEQHLYNGSC